jgi:ABC-type Fe3+-siderophore transport system permease subunit
MPNNSPVSTLTGTMTTLTPAVAFVGLVSDILTANHINVSNQDIIYATVLVTAIVHGLKFLAQKLFPKVFDFGNNPVT